MHYFLLMQQLLTGRSFIWPVILANLHTGTASTSYEVFRKKETISFACAAHRLKFTRIDVSKVIKRLTSRYMTRTHSCALFFDLHLRSFDARTQPYCIDIHPPWPHASIE